MKQEKGIYDDLKKKVSNVIPGHYAVQHSHVRVDRVHGSDPLGLKWKELRSGPKVNFNLNQVYYYQDFNAPVYNNKTQTDKWLHNEPQLMNYLAFNTAAICYPGV